MRTKNNTIIMALAGIVFLFASCKDSINNVEESVNLATEKSSELAALQTCNCTFSGTLTDEDVAGLMEMREEEKLARDVYSYFYETYGNAIFSNIATSEEAHTSAVLYLINGYGLTDPTPSEVAQFSAQIFTDLYQQLTTAGSASLIEALKTGAFIEEYDINDLQGLLAVTENEDLLMVYGNLLAGSKNHLRAFSMVLNSLGETYTPQVLTEEEYQQILSESNGKGNGYKGSNGKGQNGSGNGNGGNGNTNSSAQGSRNQNRNGKG
ncbi:MAG: DUF2202 domain-containing protein [Draconibacterium sp.]